MAVRPEPDTAVGDASVYFSIRASDAGLFDQLLQFSGFYKLGRSLRFAYLHVPFQARRSGELAFELLGLNDFWLTRDLHVPEFACCLDLPVDDGQLLDAGGLSLEALKEFVSKRVDDLRASVCGPLLVRFRLGNVILRRFFASVNTAIPDLPDQISLLDLFLAARKRYGFATVFRQDRIKVLLHIRQGDTAVLETPWQTFIPLWPNSTIATFSELTARDEIDHSQMDVEEFASFACEFCLRFQGELSLAIFSDGYRSSFRRLFRNRHRFAFSAGQREALYESSQTYDQRKFAVFSGWKDCSLCVGESEANLLSLINSAVEADVIITGSQQRMMVSLCALLYNPSRPKILVFLHHVDAPPDFKNVGLTPDKAVLILVDLRQYDMRVIVEQIRSEINRIRQPA